MRENKEGCRTCAAGGCSCSGDSASESEAAAVPTSVLEELLDENDSSTVRTYFCVAVRLLSVGGCIWAAQWPWRARLELGGPEHPFDVDVAAACPWCGPTAAE